MLRELNDAQLAWYQGQLSLDEFEQFENMRDIAEHNAMFMNPEWVQKIREARENTYQTPDEDFEKLVENTFGRKLPKPNDKSDLETFLDMDLDEVKFTPYGE